MGDEKMSGIYIPGAKIPDGDYVRVLMLHKDGTCVDGIGNVFKVIPVPPHGRLGDLDELYNHLNEWYLTHEHGFLRNEKIYIRAMLSGVKDAPTVIPASAEVSA